MKPATFEVKHRQETDTTMLCVSDSIFSASNNYLVIGLTEEELFALDRAVNLAIREHIDRKAEAIVESWQVPVAGDPKGGETEPR